MEKRVLLLCASHNDLGLIKALRKLGYYIIVTGNIPGLPGEKYADEYVQADYSDSELILKIAKEKKIDVICQCCNDFGVYTAAYVAEKLGLPGYDSYETTLLLHNKDRFKKFALQHNISTPRSYDFTSIKQAVEWADTAQYPLIVKPVDCSAGNGVQKIERREDAKRAIEEAFEKSRQKRIVLERFVSGTQHGFCTFICNQKVVAYSTNNEYSIINPYRVEIDTFPADNYKKVSTCLITQIEKIADLLKLKDGIFHLQYIMEGETPQIIEVMRRILGNMYSVPANMLNGFDWDYWEARAKCGLSCENFPRSMQQEGFYAYKTILAGKNGTIKNISIPKSYEKYLLGTFFVKKPGDKIQNYEKEPIGFMFLIFPSNQKMRQILIENYQNNIVEID